MLGTNMQPSSEQFTKIKYAQRTSACTLQQWVSKIYIQIIKPLLKTVLLGKRNT